MANSSSFRPTALTWVLVVLGALALIASVIYWTQPANALPSFFPGASSLTAHHHKHSLAAAGLGVVLLIGAWMTTGGKRD